MSLVKLFALMLLLEEFEHCIDEFITRSIREVNVKNLDSFGTTPNISKE